MKTNIIINRDALFALKELPAESVHCAVTSPPYYALRDYGLDAQIGREDTPVMLSRLVDTFFSRTSWTMLLYAENHSISVA